MWKSKTATSEVEPFEKWSIITQHKDGTTLTLSGLVSWEYLADPPELLRYIDAIATGLRDAGFEPDVILHRTNLERR